MNTSIYSGDPASSGKDLVRFLLSDTDTDNAALTDAEIEFLLSQWNQLPYEAARAGAETLAARATSQADTSKSIGDLSISTTYQSQADKYRALASQLANQSSRLNPPHAYTSADALRSTATRTKGATTDFVVGQFDNPSSGSPDGTGV